MTDPTPLELLTELQAAVHGTTIARAHPPAMEWLALIADVDDMRTEIGRLQAAIDAWKLMAEGRQGLLVAYRTHGSPTEKTWRTLAKAEKALAALEADGG